MFTRLVLAAMLLPIALSPTETISAQEPPPPSGSACLPVESPDMRALLSSIRWMVSRDVSSSPKWWTMRLFEGKRLPPEAVTPVLEEEVCAKVVRILKADVAFSDSTADAAAVVRVDGKYIAIFRFRAAQLPRMTQLTFYFDRGFTKVVTRTQ